MSIKTYSPSPNGEMKEDADGQYILITDLVNSFRFDVEDVDEDMAYGTLSYVHSTRGYPEYILDIPIKEMGLTEPVQAGDCYHCIANPTTLEYSFKKGIGDYLTFTPENKERIKKEAREMYLFFNGITNESN